MRLAIIGLGLIGSSIARAAAGHGWSVSGWDADPGPLRAAARAGLLRSAESPEAAATEAELTVLAAPPLAVLELIDRLGPMVARRGASLTDVASIKGPVLKRADEVAGLHFVGGHPMSGRERSGFKAGAADLFVGRPWVLVPGARVRRQDLTRARALARACGARPVMLGAAEHDRAVAAISHLPLLLSAALAESALEGPDWPTARQLAAQGFRDMTRLARGDPAMGAGILAGNPVAVRDALLRLQSILERWSDDLGLLAAGASGEPMEQPERGDAARMEARLRAIARGLRDEVRLP
jgi:prephenate dehydrogenase